jgi:hypothetical protein
MLLAIIPFIAEGVANDWPKAVACLERTIGSILGNRESDLRAIVICQDRPPLKLDDERYIFLETKLPKPEKEDVMAKHRDKGGKLIEAFTAAKQLSPEYVMFVDADDLISNSLVSYVFQRPNFDAFCLKIGYEWREGSSHFTIRPSFNQVCATAFICRFNERNFPALLGNKTAKGICELGHNLVEAAMDAEGLVVDKIFEPKAVYVTGHVNHMYQGYHHLTIRRRIKDLVRSPWRNRRLTADLKREFGLLNASTE